MPTGGYDGEYQAIYTAYSSNTTNFKNAALRTPLSGIFSSGSVSSQGSLGYFWASTRYDDARMDGLSVQSKKADPQGIYYRARAISVRCILGS